MSSNRRGALSSALPQKSHLIQQLEQIDNKARGNRQKFSAAVRMFSDIINTIFNNSYIDSNNKNRKISPAEEMKLEETLGLLRNPNPNVKLSDQAQRMDSRVYLLEARYSARRCHVEQALGMYRDIEKRYPRFKHAYNCHYDLLEWIHNDLVEMVSANPSDTQAKKKLDSIVKQMNIVASLKESNCRKPMAKEEMAPGYGREKLPKTISFFGYTLSQYAEKPNEKFFVPNVSYRSALIK